MDRRARLDRVMYVLSVFKNRESLSPNYPIEQHWNRLPHREEKITALKNFYGDILEKRGRSYLRRLQIIGPAGSGKTCTLKFFGQLFETEAQGRGIDLRHVYINLKFEGGRRTVFYRNLLGKIDSDLVAMNLSVEEMLHNLFRYLRQTERYVLLTVDEVDYYVQRFRGEGIVYDLTRLDEMTPGAPCGVVGVTFLARDKSFHDLLDPAELSTLGRVYHEFKPYRRAQIEEIVTLRAEEAFRNGAVPVDTVEFIARITAQPPINGDLRYALDLLLYAGNLADNQGSVTVTLDHVRKVHSVVTPTITTEDIRTLPAEEKVVLLGVVNALKSNRQAYVPLREVEMGVLLTCEQLGLKRVRDTNELLQDLKEREVVEIKSLLEIGISGVALEDLDRFLNHLIERLQSDLHER